MNICLVCREVVVDLHGGLPRATCALASALAEAGHRVTLLTDLSPAPAPALDGVDVVRVRLDDVGAAFPDAAPESAPHNLLHAAAVWREVSRRHLHDAPVDVVLAPLWRSEGAVCVLDRRWPTVVSCMTSLRTLVELDSGYLALADLEQRLAFERAALRRSPYLHGLTHAVLDKTIADYELAPQATAVIGRGWPTACGPPIACGLPMACGSRCGRLARMACGLRWRAGLRRRTCAVRRARGASKRRGRAVRRGRAADCGRRSGAVHDRRAASRPGVDGVVRGGAGGVGGTSGSG